MSEEICSSLSVGFFMSYEEALRPFCFEKEEVSHEEDRFHPKSGKKIGIEKVVDVEGGTYVRLEEGGEEWGPVVFGGDDGYGSPSNNGTDGFLEALAHILGCQVESFGGTCTFVGFNVALKGDYADDSYDPTNRFFAGSSIYLSKVVEMGDRVKSLLKAMKIVGFKDPGRPVVYNAFTVYH